LPVQPVRRRFRYMVHREVLQVRKYGSVKWHPRPRAPFPRPLRVQDSVRFCLPWPLPSSTVLLPLSVISVGFKPSRLPRLRVLWLMPSRYSHSEMPPRTILLRVPLIWLSMDSRMVLLFFFSIKQNI
jgi:hypothetical protein